MKLILLTLLCLFIVGCNKSNNKSSEYQKLIDQNRELYEENQLLKDSLSHYDEDFLLSQIILGIPDEEVLKVGQKNNIKFLLHTYKKEIPKYEIFKINGTIEEKVGTGSSTIFEYQFIPTSVNDNELNLKIKIPYKDRTIEIPVGMRLRIKE